MGMIPVGMIQGKLSFLGLHVYANIISAILWGRTESRDHPRTNPRPRIPGPLQTMISKA